MLQNLLSSRNPAFFGERSWFKNALGAKCKQGCQAQVRAAAGRKPPPAQDSQEQKQAAEPAYCRRGTANR